MSAGAGGVAAGGGITGSALGDNSRVTYVDKQYVAEAGVPVGWPVVVGTVPVLASAFQPREVLRQAVDEARGHGRSVVLASDTPHGERSRSGTRASVQVMSGGGGVGKSQLAAAYAREAVTDGADLVVWTPATDIQQVLTVYAQAAALVQAPGHTGTDLETDARAFLSWLAATDRRWLVILDDITNPDAIEPWWPDSQRGTGWTLATTRLKDPRLTGGGRTRIDVDVYTPTEATDYLTTRLTHDHKAHLADHRAPALAEALGHLPLALGHAAAYMLRENTSCSTYLEQFTDRATHLDKLLPHWADAERYGRQVTTTLLLALDATDQDPHGPLARTALRITAYLDPAGQPAALWTTNAFLTYLIQQQRAAVPARRNLGLRRRRRSAVRTVTGDEAAAALRLLDRYGLITYDSADNPRAVRIHALTARAVRETTPQDQQPTTAVTAADTLVEIWPDPDHTQRELASTLRANTDSLTTHAGESLWTPDAHPVLYRTGASLLNAHLHSASSTYWEHMVADCERLLGDEHPDTLAARASLAASYWQAGRTNDAIEIEEHVLAEYERLLGNEHPHTLAARASLAASYRQAGRTNDAINLLEHVLAEYERLLGNEHLDTLAARASLAASYRQAGRTNDAIEIEEPVLAQCERLLGNEHPHTLSARANLAASYRQAGRTNDAIEIEEPVLAQCERLLGNEHPDTLSARANLAASYRQAGRTNDAIEIEERVLADRERLLGNEHPDTCSARDALSRWRSAGDGLGEPPL
ncbi:FxSxx-COOH system tetratricopeptide repeat protein (plasmid) [Streptomyces sp. NBC_01591]|uniref:FxSxx-COOH system tetratricopeptide repeat protein n=1 Tax=Streptomyces sp. NBC_01591 TaxID=2975888 RepID=UPI002DD95EE8|nr:FxSxx-COOH system tetratricopeptide repeat protein [Streptomyces sp. NBC_01591]WSD66036.1 FxSxx-COOH system tetratricopeptide repeat protein [Streptomyces sp. NBC_01591]WSD73082.1 FxSxx-COOH system tetratricopeptide repeat protein [Streptomyces sp. NBC_01591]WSD73643.1 FxSxx-COOH system tetratricopeptide repeat protein [Streptomyces sp. NBC_01591]WSD74570.1 FxSxx-COOH system tetratricopeptide repeat protein [Streptomyces sp. NBC_01591]